MFANGTICEIRSLTLVAIALVLAGGGCHSYGRNRNAPIPIEAPRELNKITQPEYTIEPPDVLLVDLLTAVPKSPYLIKTLDSMAIRVKDTPPDAPIAGVYLVELEGVINLGVPYGSVSVVGKSVAQAKKTVEDYLKNTLKAPLVELSLAQTRGAQQVRGPHLVRPEGSVSLGSYGSVRVVGLTVPEAKLRIESHLSAYFDSPEISLEISGYNSKVYYLIFDGAGAGQQVLRLPITGNETVLDGVSQASGLQTISDAKRIWISRPSPDGCPCQIMPIDWKAITECGDTRTNYQLMPGDRVFVNSYRATRFDTTFSRVVSPIERLLGFTLLGVGTARSFSNFNNNNSSNNNQGFGN